MIRAWVLMLVCAAAASGLTRVTLRPGALVAGPGVTLAEIAELTGDDAAELGAVVVAADLHAARAIGLRDVREALDAHGVNWGRVALSGGECRVRLGAPRLVTEAGRGDDAEAGHAVVSLAGPATVRTRVARVLAELYGAANEDLRVRFEARDEAFLEQREGGRVYEVTAGAGASSERVPVIVTVFEGGELIETRSVRADVQVRRPVVQLRRGAGRGEAIEPGMLMEDVRWIAPGGSPAVGSIAETCGMLARTRLSAGTVLREAHLDRPVLVKRNQLVTVVCLSGSVSMRVEARAMGDGRMGDEIEFRADRRSEPFRARVSGTGLAVAVAGTGVPAEVTR